MIAFLCLLSLVIIVYVYRSFARLGGSFPGGMAESAGEPPPFATSPWAVPAALAAGWVFKGLWREGLGFPFDVMCHETGHSLTAWLGGRWSIPVIAGVAITDSAYSLFLSVLVSGVIAWLVWKAVRARSPLLLFCCALLIAGFVHLQFLVPEGQFEEYLLLGGHAGEFVFPALLIAAFYFRGPAGLRWDWFRYPFLVAAAFSLVGAWQFWAKAVGDPVTGIYGVSVADRSVAGSDISRLIGGYGWTAQLAVDRFLSLGRAAWLFVALVYLGFLFSRRRGGNTEQEIRI